MSHEVTYQYVDYGQGYSPREIVGSRAFNLEYGRSVTDQELRDDIISYLGEYRLQVPKYDYQLVFASDGTQPQMVRDFHRGESMRKKARRAIEERTYRGEPIHREIAEEKGIFRLEEQLHNAKSGDTILWMSPPGSKEQGYGEYSFLYKGKVTKYVDGSAHLAMQAIRLNKATLEQGRDFFTTVTGHANHYVTPEDFIANPVVLPFTIPEPLLDRTLTKHFRFETSEKDQRKLLQIIQKMDRHIDEFIVSVKHKTKKERLKAFHALENYAIYLDREYEKYGEQYMPYREEIGYINLAALVDVHGFTPPTTGGSCGSSGSETRNNILQSPLQSLLKNALAEVLFGDELTTDCETCGEANTDNHYHCPGCNREYADETSLRPEERTQQCGCGFEFECGEKASRDEKLEEHFQGVDLFIFDAAERKEKRTA